jgi:hypothetical protein
MFINMFDGNPRLIGICRETKHSTTVKCPEWSMRKTSTPQGIGSKAYVYQGIRHQDLYDSEQTNILTNSCTPRLKSDAYNFV